MQTIFNKKLLQHNNEVLTWVVSLHLQFIDALPIELLFET